MTWQDSLQILEAAAIFVICFDDHEMVRLARESLAISRESLEAQKTYLELRLRWYQSRTKPKEPPSVS
jgi:hypothetical protein